MIKSMTIKQQLTETTGQSTKRGPSKLFSKEDEDNTEIELLTSVYSIMSVFIGISKLLGFFNHNSFISSS